MFLFGFAVIQNGLVRCPTSTDRQVHLCKVVVVEVENSEVLQAREGSRGHTADSVLQQESIWFDQESDIDNDDSDTDDG